MTLTIGKKARCQKRERHLSFIIKSSNETDMGRKPSPIEYRKELRVKILNIAINLYRAKGYKAVKMDEVAQSLNISKRTLYEIYPNKEMLIYESLKTLAERSYASFKDSLKETDDTMDILASYFKMRIHEISLINPLMISDLRFYPQVKKFLENDIEDHNEYSAEFFHKTQDEGFFIADVNLDILRLFNKAVFDYLSSSEICNKFEPSTILKTFLVIFVRGICTEKGMKRIDALLETI